MWRSFGMQAIQMEGRMVKYCRVAIVCICAMAIFFMLAGPAASQERGVPVYEKPRPDYDPLGIRAGAFTIRPDLTLGLEYNDNIYAADSGEESDWITTVAPEVDVRTNWVRHALGLNTGLEAGFYGSESDENYVDGHVFLDGRLDVLRGAFLNAAAGYHYLHEERGAPDADAAWDEPANYHRWDGDLSYFHGLGRLSLTLGTDFTRMDYRRVDLVGGGSENLDYRDRNIFDVNARVAYEMHPDVHPFIQTSYNWRRYDNRDPGLSEKRDSDGYRIGVGTGFDLGGVTSGEIFAGYMSQSYDNLRDISGMWYGMNLLWNVTQLTSVEAGVRKSVKETTARDASGIDAIDTNLRVDHELLRNLLVGAFFDYTYDDYQGRDISDKYYVFGPRVTYLWNRNLSAEAGYTRRIKDSNVSAREYTENRFKVSITGSF